MLQAKLRPRRVTLKSDFIEKQNKCSTLLKILKSTLTQFYILLNLVLKTTRTLKQFFMKKLFLWLILSIVATLLLYSCQEEDFQENINQAVILTEESINLDNPLYRDFFDFNYFSSSPLSQRNGGLIGLSEQTYEFQPSTLDAYEEVTTIIYFQEMAKPFLGDLIRKDGYPIWDRSINLPSSETDLLYAVPFSKVDGDEITAMLVVTRYDGNIRFTYWTKEELGELLFREDIYQSHIDMAELTLEANTWTYANDETELQRTLDEMERMPLNDSRCSPTYVEGETFEWGCTSAIVAETEVRSGGTGCPPGTYEGWVSVGVTQIFVSWDGCDDADDGGGNGGTPPGTGWPGDGTNGGNGGSPGSGSTYTGNNTNVGTDLGWNGGTIIGELGDTKGGKDFTPNLYLITELGNNQYYFSLQERKWLKENPDVLSQIMEYINQNGGTLNDEQQGNITDHAWLAQTFTNFDPSEYPIGSNEWTEAATEIIMNSYPEWSLEPNLQEGINESLSLTLKEFYEYIGSLEQQVAGSVLLPHSKKVEDNSISNDGIPQGIIQFDYNIVGTEYDGYNPKFRIGFNYEGYPTTIEEEDMGNLFVDFKQNITNFIYLDMGEFTPTGPITHMNGNMGQNPVNVLVITVLGDLTLGVKVAKMIDYTVTRSVTVEFNLFMSSNYDWVNNPNEPRFIASDLHINGI